MTQQSNDSQPNQALPRSEAQEHVRASLHGLSVRMVHLSSALGVSLANTHDMERVMRRPASAAVPLDRRVTPDRRGEARAGRGPDRRVAHQWDELRGLLVLRYGVQKRCLDEFGIEATRRIVGALEADMRRSGFDPGAAGILLDDQSALP